MATEPDETLPPWSWRLLGAAAVGLLLLAVAGISLISAGAFDPHPIGPLQETHALDRIEVESGARTVQWLARPAPDAPFTVRLLAAHTGGEADAAYGLALGDESGAFFVAVSPLGYVSVWQEQEGGDRVEQMPWQTWPHVRGGEDTNEIEVEVGEDRVVVRLNRELLWQERLTLAPAAAGAYAQSFGGPAAFDFREVALYYQTAP